jgi:hypothetical protein
LNSILRSAAAGLVLAAATISVDAQPPGRIATTAAALVASPVFFHGKQIAIRHPIAFSNALTQLEGTARPVFVMWKDRSSRTEGEIRGEFCDIGRLQEGDPRLGVYDFRAALDAVNEGRWPARDQIFAILGASVLEAPLPPTPTLRAIALAPDRYEDKRVTVSGRFKGGNLYGDLPQGPRKSRWDFVLQSADGAVWVSELRPRGRDFDLDPTARVDTGRWLEVTGTVKREGPIVWIAGESVRLTSELPTPDEPVEVATPALKDPPPRIIFSAPLADDTDIELTAPVRIQFSRPMDGRTFRDRIRASYAGGPQGAPPAPPAFTSEYDGATRSIQLTFAQPLDRFRTVKIELLEGITAVDGQPLPPWTLTFATGG